MSQTITQNPFTEHTLDTAPAASRRSMEAVSRKLGRMPSAVARLAGSPSCWTASSSSTPCSTAAPCRRWPGRW